jgi:hypothetical protein
MGAFKRLVHTVSKLLGLTAGVAFFLCVDIALKLSYEGLVFMVCAAVLALICFAAYMWSEPDIDLESDSR